MTRLTRNYDTDGKVTTNYFYEYAYNDAGYQTQYDIYDGEDNTGTHYSLETYTYGENNFRVEERNYVEPDNVDNLDYSSNVYTVDSNGNILTDTYTGSSTPDTTRNTTAYTWLAR